MTSLSDLHKKLFAAAMEVVSNNVPKRFRTEEDEKCFRAALEYLQQVLDEEMGIDTEANKLLAKVHNDRIGLK